VVQACRPGEKTAQMRAERESRRVLAGARGTTQKGPRDVTRRMLAMVGFASLLAGFVATPV